MFSISCNVLSLLQCIIIVTRAKCSHVSNDRSYSPCSLEGWLDLVMYSEASYLSRNERVVDAPHLWKTLAELNCTARQLAALMALQQTVLVVLDSAVAAYNWDTNVQSLLASTFRFAAAWKEICQDKTVNAEFIFTHKIIFCISNNL